MRPIDLNNFALRYSQKSTRGFGTLLLVSVALGLLCLGSPALAKLGTNAAPVPESKSANQSANLAEERFNEGVKAYRNGEYEQASKILEALHRQYLEKDKFTYYLAITQAQLGRFQQAKQLYEEIITLDPNGEPATLAKQGLQYLPPETSIDPPPRFNQFNQTPSATALPDANRAAAQAYTSSPNTGANTSAPPSSGISPQDLMAWQMLMGQNNGSNYNNPMGMFMPGMMGMPNGTSSNGAMDLSIMSTMLMNQMMQNMNLSGEQEPNR